MAGGILLLIAGSQETLNIQIPTGPLPRFSSFPLSMDFWCRLWQFLSLAAAWLILIYFTPIQRLIGYVVIGILAWVLGMLLSAIAVRLIAEGIIALL